MTLFDKTRRPTQSPDHFTCRCGYWCLNSPCPRCEAPAEAAT